MSKNRLKKDVENILKRDEPGRSGGEIQYLKDIGELPKDLDPVPETIISNEEAGYDQAEYDEMEDSAMTPEEIATSERAAWNKLYDLEGTKKISDWNDKDKALAEEMTGFTYDELLDMGVTQPDGMTIEEIFERGRNDDGSIGHPLTEDERASLEQ